MNIGFPRLTVSGLRRFAVFALLLVGPLTGAAAASDRQWDAEQLQQRVEAINERLKLSPEQSDRLAPVFSKALETRRDILAKYGISRDIRPELSIRQKMSLAREMRAARDESDAEIGQHLNAEQRAELGKLRDEWRDKFLNRDR